MLSPQYQTLSAVNPALALRKAGLTADKVWYCGDSIEADVYGAKSADIFPVLYSGETADEINPFADQNEGLTVEFNHLHIHDWRELIDILEKEDGYDKIFECTEC